MRTFPPAWRWTLVAVIAVVALAVAVWPRDHHRSAAAGPVASSETVAVPGELRAAAGLTDCPHPAAGVAPVTTGPLAGLTLDCLATGAPVDLAAALAGRPTLLNLWAYWCQPCARELPAVQQYATRASNRVNVLTVHSDPAESRALARLSDLGVHLPGVQDADARLRTAVRAPAVLPVSVLLRADGSLAKVVVRPFDNADDIAATVDRELGIAA
ncbi:TlpA family protein disulfide reductase [Nocardia sp. alder85J]|uniref:TlpA family protein disulfide reductase n=1 Tax=Nocardia sp. alder85J TaxID=2862949 RepID=UPI001CD328EB|nr:TlpA disulfide reductase family protein [Nocardia sp. alder85J]MCX4093642.1 TlpA disulfide reductase family protein [Nocardia sp. alder85J]